MSPTATITGLKCGSDLLNSKKRKGNSDGVWGFLEGRPAGGGETFANPCDKWFCNAGHFSVGSTKTFATQFNRDEKIIYPMAWDIDNQDIPGVDRSEFYSSVCAKC